MEKNVLIFLFNGYSDWEISYLTPEINKNERFKLVYCTKDGNTVRSMGGLRVKPDISISEITSEDLEILILPGGTAWEKGENRELDEIMNSILKINKPIAAICAATTYLGQLGILNDLKHTSNDLDYLKAMAPKYIGENNYIKSFAVSDKNIITANGIAPIEFAREVFRKLQLYSEEEIEKWFQLFKNGIWHE